MLVSFNAVNYAQRQNFKSANMNFKGNAETKTREDILNAINAIGDLPEDKRAGALNSIAIYLYNHPEHRGNDFARAAVAYIPAADGKHSDTKYAVELLRLLKYAQCEADVMEEVNNAIKSRQLSGSIAKASKGFKTTSCNICGQEISMNEALGYSDRIRRGKPIFVQRKSQEE